MAFASTSAGPIRVRRGGILRRHARVSIWSAVQHLAIGAIVDDHRYRRPGNIGGRDLATTMPSNASPWSFSC
jgi:hypothetical protein